MSRRLLSEDFYDFYVVDGRDGEAWGPFHSLQDAKDERTAQRKKLPSYERCVIEIEWEMSEARIAKALAQAYGKKAINVPRKTTPGGGKP